MKHKKLLLLLMLLTFMAACACPPPVVEEPPPPAAPPPPPPPPEPEKIILNGIRFDFDKSNIKPEWVPVLDEAVEILKKNPDKNVVIEGHTDSIGTEDYNDKLSIRRATSVKNYLVENGISADRLSMEGYGEGQPVADNGTKDGRAMNRRVEFKVIE